MRYESAICITIYIVYKQVNTFAWNMKVLSLYVLRTFSVVQDRVLKLKECKTCVLTTFPWVSWNNISPLVVLYFKAHNTSFAV